MNESCYSGSFVLPSCLLGHTQTGTCAQSEAGDRGWKWSADMGTSIYGESVGLTTKPCVLIHQRWRLSLLLSTSKLCTSWVTSVLDALQVFISHRKCLHLLFRQYSSTLWNKVSKFLNQCDIFFTILLLFLLLLYFSVSSTIIYSCLSSYFLICSSLCLLFSLVVIIFSMFKAQLKQRHRLQSSYNKPSFSLLIIQVLGWMIVRKANPS